jgi:hypothetical protein
MEHVAIICCDVIDCAQWTLKNDARTGPHDQHNADNPVLEEPFSSPCKGKF